MTHPAAFVKEYPEHNIRAEIVHLGVTRGMPPKNRWSMELRQISDNALLSSASFDQEIDRTKMHEELADHFVNERVYKWGVKEDRPEMLSEGGFIDRARGLVAGLYYSKSPNFLDLGDVYCVWFCKTLQNWKALISTNAKDDRYYEVTHNGDTGETYVDAYSKVENIVVPPRRK